MYYQVYIVHNTNYLALGLDKRVGGACARAALRTVTS